MELRGKQGNEDADGLWALHCPTAPEGHDTVRYSQGMDCCTWLGESFLWRGCWLEMSTWQVRKTGMTWVDSSRRNPACRCTAMTPCCLIWIQFLWKALWPAVRPHRTGHMLTVDLAKSQITSPGLRGHSVLLLVYSKLVAAILAASPWASLTSGACLPAPPLTGSWLGFP